MYTKTEKFTTVVNKQTGELVISKTGNICATTESGVNVWLPKGARLGSEITYKVHEKGDSFIALKDSSRTKGVILGSDCPEGKEDEPLYFKGESVVRQESSVEFVGFAGDQILSFEEKVAIMAKHGVAIKL